MSTPPARTSPAPQSRPELRRDPDGGAIAGLASGLARHLGLPVTWLRAGFVALSFLDGLGVLLYALLWVLVPPTDGPAAAGLESASRRGLRQQRTPAPHDAGVIVSMVSIIVGIGWVLASGGTVVPRSVFWPMVLGGMGVVTVWLQADRAGEVSSAQRHRLWGRLTRGRGLASALRLIGGLALVGIGSSWIIATQVGMAELPQVLVAAALLLTGFLVVAAPWLYQQRNRVKVAEAERVRAQERADMAAHLHDSVLQTLALIQRQSDDPAAVATLARRQERELRSWLYGTRVTARTLSAALEQIRTDAEAAFGVQVEVVCVGDLLLDERTEPLVLAAREAVTNAGKHSGAPRVDVFAEVSDRDVEIFVRDRGQGFDPDSVGADRAGVRQSILSRMERHGGSARVRSTPGGGTEVRLEISR